MHRPRVLAAAPPPALPFLDEALGAHVELVACHGFEEAKRRLGEARASTSSSAGSRILDFEMPPVSLKAQQIACESLGAAFLDRLSGAARH